jgi:hypothetical protein
MLEKIPQKRLISYLILIGLLPITFVLIHFFSKQSAILEIKNSMEYVQHNAFLRERKQAVNMAVRNFYRDADHFYIDKNLETQTFLEPEIESLQKIGKNALFPEDDQLKKRLEFLTGPGNNMIFSEGVVQSYPLFQETTETLVHPVEVNVTDLQSILSRIEGIDISSNVPPPHRPQLIILDFKLDRKGVNDKNEVFLLNLKLLKREFL